MSVRAHRSLSQAWVPLRPVGRVRDRPLYQDRDDPARPSGPVLERLVAGVVVIGLLLWGASLLATPDDAMPDPSHEPETRDDAPPDAPALAPPRVVPDEGDDEDDDDDDEDRSSKRGKRKRD